MLKQHDTIQHTNKLTMYISHTSVHTPNLHPTTHLMSSYV